MEQIAHGLAVLFKLGVGVCVGIVVVVYLAYALESHCANPMGCKAPPGTHDQGSEWDEWQKQQTEAARLADNMYKYGRKNP